MLFAINFHVQDRKNTVYDDLNFFIVEEGIVRGANFFSALKIFKGDRRSKWFAHKSVELEVSL